MNGRQRSPKEANHEDAEQQNTSPEAHEEDRIATSRAFDAERRFNKNCRQEARRTPVRKTFQRSARHIKQACHRYPDAEAPWRNDHQ
tara:strand:+ start:21526 stop:21786 length:261 start_codon:yes stop_codon:yes gene_type:complete